LPLLEEVKRKDTIRQQIRDINAREKELRQQINRLKEELWNQRRLKNDLYVIMENPDAIPNEEGQLSNKKTYMFPCSKEGCRGFIESLSWKCCICETKVCKSCHVTRKMNKNGKLIKHECKEDDIQSAKEVMKSTKPCPSCATRIFKSLGCSQMYCTSCLTAFDWNTGLVQTGQIHNPHYLEMQRKLGNLGRNVRDIPCGGLNHHFVNLLIHDHRRFLKYMQRVGEINDRIADLGERDFMDIRVDFLSGKIKCDADFRSAIFLRERQNEKKREERLILETFRVAVTERFNELDHLYGELDMLRESPNITKYEKACHALESKAVVETLKELEKITMFCNNAFEENFRALGYNTIPKIVIEQYYRPNGKYPTIADSDDSYDDSSYTE
jgi:hypothetical protein